MKKIPLPNDFSLKKDGLYFKGDQVCSPIDVLAHTRDNSNENWGILVQFRDPDQYLHQFPIPMDTFGRDSSELCKILLSRGLKIYNKSKLAHYLQNVEPSKKVLCVPRIGWHKDSFILPDESIPESDEVYLQSSTSNFTGFRSAGTLEEWKDQVAKPCQGNSRLIFSLGCAFAAPLLPLINAESGGFHLKGSSSIGKSTALAGAASVWGSPQYIQQWRATGNAIESVAESHNNALLCLDELGQIDGKEAGEIAYMLANESGKNRLKAKGGLRRKYTWKLLFLSTGEISLADKLIESGKRANAGMLARMADVLADAGKGHRLFDTLNGFEDGGALADHLKQATGLYYGTPIRAFLLHVSEHKDALPTSWATFKKDFVEKYVALEADGQVKRVADRFALVAYAAEFAIKLGILPYEEGEASEAVATCFKSFVEARGGSSSHEAEEAIKQVQAFIEMHHSSRFALIGDNSETAQPEKIINQVGYKRKRYDGSLDFLFFTETFNKEVCKGFDPQFVKKELLKQGLLKVDSDGRYTKTTRLPHLNKNVKMICIGSDRATEEVA